MAVSMCGRNVSVRTSRAGMARDVQRRCSGRAATCCGLGGRAGGTDWLYWARWDTIDVVQNLKNGRGGK